MTNNDVLLLPTISFCRSAHQDLESTSWTLHVLFLDLRQLDLAGVLLVVLGEVHQGATQPPSWHLPCPRPSGQRAAEEGGQAVLQVIQFHEGIPPCDTVHDDSSFRGFPLR